MLCTAACSSSVCNCWSTCRLDSESLGGLYEKRKTAKECKSSENMDLLDRPRRNEVIGGAQCALPRFHEAEEGLPIDKRMIGLVQNLKLLSDVALAI